MSKLADFVKAEAEYKRLQEQLEAMKSDEGFKKELEFKKKLEDLMAKYEKSSRDVVELVNPDGKERGLKPVEAAPSGTRRKRKLKIYKNPNTGEVVETRGGNHKTLKEWKDEHGSDTVESWVQEKRD